MAIERVMVDNVRLHQLGLDGIAYIHNGEATHIQDLATAVSVNRALRVRNELEPMTKLMRARNKETEKLGQLLAALNKMETSFENDDSGSVLSKDPLTAEQAALLQRLGFTQAEEGSFPTKAQVQEYDQAVKSRTDALNSRSQMDMNRVQSLVETSDGSYETASNILSALSGSVDNTNQAVGS